MSDDINDIVSTIGIEPLPDSTGKTDDSTGDEAPDNKDSSSEPLKEKEDDNPKSDGEDEKPDIQDTSSNQDSTDKDVSQQVSQDSEEDEKERLKKDLEETRKILNEIAAQKMAEGEGIYGDGGGGKPGLDSQSLKADGGSGSSGSGGSGVGGLAGLSSLLSPDILKIFNDKISKDQEFLSKEEIDSIIDRPDLIHAAINKARRTTAQEVVEVVPYIVMSIVNDYMSMQRAVEDFYEANSDLRPYKEFVRFTAKRLASQDEYRNKSQSEFLSATANEVRKILRLPDVSKSSVRSTKSASQNAKPSFGGVSKTTGGRVVAKPSDKSSKSQSDYIADILSGS